MAKNNRKTALILGGFVLALLLIGCGSGSGNSQASNSDVTGYRGEVLYFTQDPSDPSLNGDAYHYFQDGVLYVKDGRIVDSGNYSSLKNQYKDAQIVDYSGKLIVPGFVDTHVHYPQIEMIAAYGSQLLEWLNTYTFPTEAKFNSPEHSQKIANLFLDQLVANGTTTALVFSTVDPVSVDAFFEASSERNMRMISGKVLMDRNAPDYLLDTPDSAYKDSKALIRKWHGKGRQLYAVTPRFAPTSSPSELQVAGNLVKENPGVYVHTHVAENKSEVDWVRELFPGSKSYLDVYDGFGLVTDRSVFAHGIYLTDNDLEVLARKKGSIAFCPTSNLFLGSGLFDLSKAKKSKVKVGFGTDVGAGTSLSILQTMNEAYKVVQLQKAYVDNPESIKPLDPLQSLYIATLGGAQALSLEDKIGSFKSGMEADFIVLDPYAMPLIAARLRTSSALTDKLFALEVMGDDRVVAHTYVMGRKLK